MLEMATIANISETNFLYVDVYFLILLTGSSAAGSGFKKLKQGSVVVGY